MKGIYQHTSVSLDYLEDRLNAHAPIRVQDAETGRIGPLLRETIARWRAQGYSFAPACDNIRTDGHCAGHRPVMEEA